QTQQNEIAQCLQTITLQQQQRLMDYQLNKDAADRAEREQIRLQQQREEARRNAEARLDPKTYNGKTLPIFKSGDCPMTFLQNFQRACLDIAALCEIWVHLLCSQVSGSLAEVLAEVPDMACDQFLMIIHHRLAYTPEALRLKLRNTKWDPKQSVCSLEDEINNRVIEWMRASQIQTLDRAIELIIFEQLQIAIPDYVRQQAFLHHSRNSMQFALCADEIHVYQQSKSAQFKSSQVKETVPKGDKYM
ncbi:hypothetical protein JRQ81_008570, partial [Phrynocephalus forsythii]